MKIEIKKHNSVYIIQCLGDNMVEQVNTIR